MKAKISEIFSSVQGEGLYTGAKQIFVRFYGCNLHCQFCDTHLKDHRIYSTEEVANEIDHLFQDEHSISLTGGEPLLQANFLQELLPLLKMRDYLVYLETNGTLFEELHQIIDLVEIVAMDIKLPSSTESGIFWKEHKAFLKTALDFQVELFVKSVICSKTSEEDLITAAKLIAEFNKDIPWVLQPNFFEANLAAKLKDSCHLASQYLDDVRIMRQEHKFLGVK